MRIWSDNDGFPWLDLPDLGVTIGALPFTKQQYELLWAREGCHSNLPLNDRCYEEWLAVNPRTSRPAQQPQALHLWLTGCHPHQVRKLLAHMGTSGIPKRNQWTDVEKRLEREPFDQADTVKWTNLKLCDTARQALNLSWREIKPQNWAQATLMKKGIFEFVVPRTPPGHGHMEVGPVGSPLTMAFVPQQDMPHHFNVHYQPDPMFGFRIWKKLTT